MKILFLCGVFAKENEDEVIAHAKKPVEYSANVFQEKIIAGFKHMNVALQVISAPFIGSYPNECDILWFNGFVKNQVDYDYVSFCNVWGIRNFSRAKALKNKLHSFIEADDAEKIIIVCSPHTPFVEAAAYAKRKDSKIKVVLLVPDLPQYMNLNAKVSVLYKVGKKYDVAKFNHLCRFVDCYMLLTEAMKEKLNIGQKKYVVIEGIVDENILIQNAELKSKNTKDSSLKHIVYTGKLNKKFGVKDLVDSFTELPYQNYRLVLCGRGDLDEYIWQRAREDSRILALGQVTHDMAQEWVLKADVLVNPRANDEEYTKYSFPSKNIEYLSSGNPVVGYMLDGMPACYKEYMFCIDNKIADTLTLALESSQEVKRRKFDACQRYLMLRTPGSIASIIMNMVTDI